MNELSKLVRQGADEGGVIVEELQAAEGKAIRERLASQYTAGRSEWPLWNYLTDFAYSTDPDSWKWVEDFVGGNSALLLFDETGGPNGGFQGYRFQSGQDIVRTIGECPLFEWYLTNSTTDYLLCLSDHDILYAAGSAKPWLVERLRRLQDEKAG